MKIVRLFFLALPLCGTLAAPHVIAGDLQHISHGGGNLKATQGDGRGDAFHHFINSRAALVLGAVRNLAGDDASPKSSLGPVVGRLNLRSF